MMRSNAGIEDALMAKRFTHIDPNKRHHPMKRILLSAAILTLLVFAGLVVSPAQAQPPYRRFAVVGPQVIVVNGGGYNAYRTYGGYGYSNYGAYVTPNYGLSVAPYGAGYVGGYQPYQQMYYQRVYYGSGF